MQTTTTTTRILAGAAACAGVLAGLARPHAAHATSVSASANNISLVRSDGVHSGATRLTAEGLYTGSTSASPTVSSYANFGVIDFAPVQLPALTSFNSVSGVALNFQDLNEYFSAPGDVNFYLTTNTAPLSNIIAYTPSSSPSPTAPNEGLQNQLGSLTGDSNGTLYYLGTGAYAGSGGSNPSTAGTPYTYSTAGNTINNSTAGTDDLSLSLSGAAASYLQQQANSGQDVRVIMTPGAGSAADNFVSADFNGTNTSALTSAGGGQIQLVPPQIQISGATTTTASNSSVLNISASNANINTNKAVEFDYGRVVQGTGITQSVNLSNAGASGATARYYLNDNPTVDANGASASGVAGTNPLAGGAATAISAVFNTANVAAGSSATAGLTVQNNSNANDATAQIKFTAADVVQNRQIGNVEGQNGIDFGNVLVGGSATKSDTLTTTNSPNNAGDFSSTYLTTVTLAANTTINAPTSGKGNLFSAPQGDTSYVTMAAGSTDVQFNSNPTANTATRNFAYTVPGGNVGGAYNEAAYYIGGANFALTQNDAATGAPNNPNGSIYVIGDVYQAASIAATATTNGTGVLVNAAPDANSSVGATDVPNSTTVFSANGGLRDYAVVVNPGSLDAANTQTGWIMDTGFVAGTHILANNDGATNPNVVAANFSAANPLNGTYYASLTGVGLRNGTQPMQNSVDSTALAGTSTTGADLGANNTFALATTVTGNVGIAGTPNTADILANQSYGGYSITRSASDTGSQQTTVSFLGGTASSRNTVGVNFAATPPTTLQVRSDVAGLSGFNANSSGQSGDNYVVQMSYNPRVINGAANSPVLAWYNGSRFASSISGNSSGTPMEFSGAFIPSSAAENQLGAYGVDTINHTVWAVVNHTGQFAVEQRFAGDVNNDGHVNVSDVNIIRTNFGLTNATWSQGAVTGSGTVNVSDVNVIRQNFGQTPSQALATLRSSVQTTSAANTDTSSLVVNTSTGDVRLMLGSTASLSSYEIDSASGSLVTANLHSLASQFSGDGFSSYADKAKSISEATLGNGPTASQTTPGANGQYYIDFGNIFNVHGTRDLSYLAFDNAGNEIDGTTGAGQPAIYIGGTIPEPATLGLLAIGGVALVSRRRKRAC